MEQNYYYAYALHLVNNELSLWMTIFFHILVWWSNNDNFIINNIEACIIFD